MHQPSACSAAELNPTRATQVLSLGTISSSQSSQIRPQVARKAVPLRKPIGETNAVIPKPQNSLSDAPLKIIQDNIPIRHTPFGASVHITQPQILATDGLPAGWSSALDANGRVYYLNHTTRQTSWAYPVEIRPTLPLDWEERSTPDGKIYYFNTCTQSSSWERPYVETKRRKSSVVSPGTSTRQGSISTVDSGPTSPGFSILSDTSSPLTSGPTSPMMPTFHNPFPSSYSGLQSQITSDNFTSSPIEWETTENSSKQTRRRSQFSLPSLSSSTTRKLHLSSIPSPHLPSNTPASLRQSVDFGVKTGKIAADYGKKGAKLVIKGAKNPNTRKTIAVGIKGFKIANGIVKAVTGVSLGAEFLPDLDFLGDIGSTGDIPVDGIGEDDSGDILEEGGFDVSGAEINGDASFDAVGAEGVSVEYSEDYEVITADTGVAIDTPGVDYTGTECGGAETILQVDTADVETVEVETVEVETVEVETVGFETVEVETVEFETVEVETVGFETVEVETVEFETVETSAVEVETVEVETVGFETVETSTVEVETVEVETVGFETVEVETVEFETVETSNEASTVEVNAFEVDTFQATTVEFYSNTDYTADYTTMDTSTAYLDVLQVSTIEVDTVEIEATQAEYLQPGTIPMENVQVDAFQAETYQMDTVQVDTLENETVDTYMMEEYILSSDIIAEDQHQPRDVEYVEEVDVSVLYIPCTDEEEGTPNREHTSLESHRIYALPYYPPRVSTLRKSITSPPQLIPGHSGGARTPQMINAPEFAKQMNSSVIPAPLCIRPRRKATPSSIVREIIE